ncbi:MAG: hypothetical protein JNK12_12175 [Acidimicrobiales bacterium]|nr:hypothetical protein [Acidimicrobiales bacterium]
MLFETPQCDRVAYDLAAAAGGTGVLAPGVRRHVDHCLRCQAEAAQHRKLARALETLGTVELVPPAGLTDEVLLSLDEAEQASVLGHLRHHRAAYLGGLAAGVASVAGVAGAIVLARSRRSLGRVA